MATISRDILKQWFSRGKYPLASQFADWIDSFWHRSDALPLSSVSGLDEALNRKAEAAALERSRTASPPPLQTDAKTIVEAINEVHDSLGPYDASATPYTSETARDEGIEDVEAALDTLYAAKAEEMTVQDIDNLNWN